MRYGHYRDEKRCEHCDGRGFVSVASFSGNMVRRSGNDMDPTSYRRIDVQCPFCYRGYVDPYRKPLPISAISKAVFNVDFEDESHFMDMEKYYQRNSYYTHEFNGLP